VEKHYLEAVYKESVLLYQMEIYNLV